jgi:hypothetical protein
MSASIGGIKNIEAQTFNGLSVQKVYFQSDFNLDLADRLREDFIHVRPGIRGAGHRCSSMPQACPSCRSA